MKSKNICGERIRLARLKQKKSQTDISAEMEIDYGIKIDGSTMGKIERGVRGIYDYELLALSEILDISLVWLLKGGKLDVP